MANNLTRFGKPKVSLNLGNQDGNVFGLMARVGKLLKKTGHTNDQVKDFIAECRSADYDHALQTIMSFIIEEE